MNTEAFIRAAVEGGWKASLLSIKGRVWELNTAGNFLLRDNEVNSDLLVIDKSEILLSPNAWAAVGKVLGWPGDIKAQAKYYMREFITYIAAGKSIEAALGEVLALNSK